jgi:hypothetical protein
VVTRSSSYIRLPRTATRGQLEARKEAALESLERLQGGFTVMKDPGDHRLSRGSTIMGPAGLTAVFGMGTGVTPPVWSPEKPPAGCHATPAAFPLDVRWSITRSSSCRSQRHPFARQVGHALISLQIIIRTRSRCQCQMPDVTDSVSFAIWFLVIESSDR